MRSIARKHIGAMPLIVQVALDVITVRVCLEPQVIKFLSRTEQVIFGKIIGSKIFIHLHLTLTP